MRGKLSGRGIRVESSRLIPAHAGKTIAQLFHVSKHWAHPRACGENATGRVGEQILPGSSPRMRGKQVSGAASERTWGLIPAHAGKTREPGKARSQARAHPRACGENYRRARVKAAFAGSSPRMRGKPVFSSAGPWAVGLIPAHAGKTKEQA